MPFRSPVSEIRFVLDHIVGFDDVRSTGMFADASADVTSAILEGGGKLCDDVMAPLNRVSDLDPPRLGGDACAQGAKHGEGEHHKG